MDDADLFDAECRRALAREVGRHMIDDLAWLVIGYLSDDEIYDLFITQQFADLVSQAFANVIRDTLMEC